MNCDRVLNGASYVKIIASCSLQNMNMLIKELMFNSVLFYNVMLKKKVKTKKTVVNNYYLFILSKSNCKIRSDSRMRS